MMRSDLGTGESHEVDGFGSDCHHDGDSEVV